MTCPRCGAEMTLDAHRKIPLNMCYECGYIEGRADEDGTFVHDNRTNFSHLKYLNFNESAAFLAKGLKLEEREVREWLLGEYYIG